MVAQFRNSAIVYICISTEGGAMTEGQDKEHVNVEVSENQTATEQQDNSIVADEIHDPEAQRDETLFRAYVGDKADKYMLNFKRLKKGDTRSGFNIGAFFLGFVWFFYRKMYLAGAVIILIPVVLLTVLPDLAGVIASGVGVALALMANTYYVKSVNKNIEQMKALDLPEDELLNRLRAKGGTSKVAGAFGLVVWISIVSLPILASATPSLPNCAATETHRTIGQMLEGALQKQKIPSGNIRLDPLEALESQGEDEVICKYQVTVGSEKFPLFAGISWLDKAKGQYQTQVAPSLEKLKSNMSRK